MPKDVATYVKGYEDRLNVKVDYPVEMGHLEGISGQCQIVGYGMYLKVVLDTSTWNEISGMEKEALVWHELSHCSLGLNDQYDNSEDVMFGYSGLPFMDWEAVKDRFVEKYRGGGSSPMESDAVR
jgi:hypothetical protein